MPPPTMAVLTLPASGHVNPSLPLLEELVRRGVRLVAWSAPEFAARLEQAGCDVRDYGDLGADYASPPPRIAGVALMLAGTTERLLPRLVPAIAAEAPSLVVHDSMAPWGRVAARALGLPSVCLTATFAVHPRVRLPPRAAMRMLGDAAAGLPDALRLAPMSRRIAAAYGTRLGPPLEVLSNRRGARTVVFTAREFQPNPAAVREEAHYVGPLLAARAGGEEAALAGLATADELVYVSLGTLFESAPAFFRAAAAGLAAPGRRVLMSVGRVTPADLGPLPDGVEAVAAVDQRAVLARASLFVTHAGMNSVHEALVAGVPMVLHPQSADQPVVAAHVARLGAGVVLRRATPAAIAAAAAAALRDGRCQAAAARLGADLRASADLGRAAALLLEAAAPAR